MSAFYKSTCSSSVDMCHGMMFYLARSAKVAERAICFYKLYTGMFD